MIFDPGIGTLALTLLVTVALLFEGATQASVAFDLKPTHGWGWMLTAALISIVAGIMIIAGLPGASLVVLGIFIGVNFLTNGVTAIMLARSLRPVAT